ncbi:dimethyladenosine transferase [Nakamurella silvestris]|nr:dimethyladenosine transferase [Nakamurella silvestris]
MDTTQIQPVDAGPRAIARLAWIGADPAEIFALLVDVRRHSEMDGSGTVEHSVAGPERLSQGARFTVRMKQFKVPYKITSRVVAFEENRLIEWRHPLGHAWRWELSPSDDGATLVTESFRYAKAKAPWALELFGYPAKNGRGIENTLRKLQQRFPR